MSSFKPVCEGLFSTHWLHDAPPSELPVLTLRRRWEDPLNGRIQLDRGVASVSLKRLFDKCA